MPLGLLMRVQTFIEARLGEAQLEPYLYVVYAACIVLPIAFLVRVISALCASAEEEEDDDDGDDQDGQADDQDEDDVPEGLRRRKPAAAAAAAE